MGNVQNLKAKISINFNSFVVILRTAIRLKTASMGLVYRKLFRLSNINDNYSAKVITEK